jgi:hypothetical protein
MVRNLLKSTVILGCSVLTVSQAQALSLRVIGGAGYESITGEKKDGEAKDPEPFTGYSVSAVGNVGFFDSIPGFSLFAGGGLRYLTLSNEEKTDDGINVESTTSETFGVLEAGAEFSMIPLLRLQALTTYELGLSGEAKVKAQGTETKLKFEKFNRLGLSGRATMSVIPFLSVGLEPTYYMNIKSKVEDKTGDSTDKSDSNATGFAIKAIAAFIF